MNASAPATVLISPEPFDPDEEMRVFRRRYGNAGAIASFLGQVRGEAEGGAVTSLRLDHYPGFAERMIEDFAGRAKARWPLIGLRIVHRVGALHPGDPIVLVAAAAAHRRAAFEAVDFLMDYLKTEAPFWKQETTSAGARWIEPRAGDYADRGRWREPTDEKREQ